MRHFFTILLVALIFSSCDKTGTDKYPVEQADWNKKQSTISNFDAYFKGITYLPVYSHIYHLHEHRTFDLTITASIRNISLTDSVYILKADYYNTTGENIRQYIKKPIYLKPLETIEIIISERDIDGGSGANFIFEWAKSTRHNTPLFEAVMISTYGQQGISFTTRGVQIVDQ